MIPRSLRYLIAVSALFFVLACGLVGGVVLDRQVLIPYTDPALPDQFQILDEAWGVIQRVYVDRSAVVPQDLAYGAVAGMVQALGDTGHSTFLTPEMVSAEHRFTQGQFEGIGAEVEMKDNHVVIVAPMDGSPAQQAGLRPGDVILRVDGEDVAGLPLQDVVTRILGPAGTSVTLTVLDPSTGATRTVTLTRARITLHNVTWSVVPGTTLAHVRIAAFSKGVTADLQSALTEIEQQGYSGVVLDVRNNPGGVLDEAIGVASQFLRSGNVLQERNAQGQVTNVPVRGGGVAYDIPVVVLVNAGTASASEIVAGALQDAGRAQIVGETTFGTGTVLKEFGLSDGSALLLATEEWLTPAGRQIWHQGISPDEVVSLPADVSPVVPEEERTMTAAQLQARNDTQLSRGISLLSQ